MAVFMPDAADLDPRDLHPTHELQDCTALLDNRLALDEHYHTQGYLFFRGLLDQDAVAATRRRMLAPLVERGLVAEDDDRANWIGGDAPGLTETSRAFDGVVQSLFESPGVTAAFERVLGEAVATVPMVQYRAYRPNGPLGGVHQDGFYSPGIAGYRPVWIPLVEMDEAVGGLTLAAGLTDRGFFHNMAKKPRSPIPAGLLPEDGWYWAHYEPGDVVVIHPHTPHVGLPNRSDRIRLSIDTRVQSAASPCVIVGVVESRDRDSVSLRLDDGAVERLLIDDETFIRTLHPGTRISRAEFAEKTEAGLRLLASRENGRALMLRRADAG